MLGATVGDTVVGAALGAAVSNTQEGVPVLGATVGDTVVEAALGAAVSNTQEGVPVLGATVVGAALGLTPALVPPKAVMK